MDAQTLKALHRKDLNQLVALAALLTTGGVTRAADTLDVTQPTMSKALTKLREAFGDPLLVRDGNTMHLTPFASELALKLQGVMGEIDALYNPAIPFSPDTVTGWLKIAANDYVQSVLGLPFVRHMRQLAPNLHIEIRPVGALYPEQLLEEGMVDIVLSAAYANFNLHHQKTFADPFICVADAANETIPESLSLDAFLKLPQVDVSPSGTGLLRRYFERTQRRFRDERIIISVLTSFASLPEVLAGSNSVALLPSRMFPFLPSGQLRTITIDFELPAYDVSIWWHPRTHTDPLISWSRAELIKLARSVAQEGTVRVTPLEAGQGAD